MRMGDEYGSIHDKGSGLLVLVAINRECGFPAEQTLFAKRLASRSSGARGRKRRHAAGGFINEGKDTGIGSSEQSVDRN